MHIITREKLLAAIAAGLLCGTSHAATADDGNASVAPAGNSLIENCLLSSLKDASPDTTVAELRKRCQQNVSNTTNGQAQDLPVEDMTLVQERMYEDQMNYGRDYVISPFKPNYIMMTHMPNPNEEPFDPISGDNDILKKNEAKFQVSMKAPVWREMFDTNNDLMFAFTSVSWWQIDNDDDNNSNAFRETNYEPEFFVRHYGGPRLPFGGQLSAFDIGLNHQSNGRTQLLSRSWNRVMGRAYLDYGDLAFALRAWYRIPESENDDDNKYMYRYYGAGDITAAYAPNKNTFTAMFRPGTQENGLELTWSYPISKYLRVYTQYWNGYGESLLDYNKRIERIGIGFALNDLVQKK
jgi:phospholipase A1